MIPATIRNNNPSGQYPGPSSRAFGGTKFETLRSRDGVHKIATFPTVIHGGAAHFHLLDRIYVGMRLDAAIAKWCGGHYVESYLKGLEQRAKVSRHDVLARERIRDPEWAVPLARAMARHETGRDFPMSEADWREAHAMAFGGGATAPAWSPDNDVPTPKPETRLNEAVKTNAPKVAIGAGGAAVVVNEAGKLIPPVPSVAQDNLQAAEGWRGLVRGIVGIGNELAGAATVADRIWPYLLVAGAAGAGLYLIRRRRRV
jgi:hypothetical protein